MGEAAVDLEDQPYHAIPADPDLGNAPAASGGSCYNVCAVLLCLLVPFLCVGVVAALQIYVDYFSAPSFSVFLAGYEGIDMARPGRMVSPAFNVTLHMNNTCADRADVVVSYAGVALGWAHVEPRGCAGQRWGRESTDVEVVARADEVGLSRPLEERMATEWRSGLVELDVDVVIYDDGPNRLCGRDVSDKGMLCKVRTDAQRLEAPPCTWYTWYGPIS